MVICNGMSNHTMSLEMSQPKIQGLELGHSEML
jgi:hypothetical protein